MFRERFIIRLRRLRFAVVWLVPVLLTGVAGCTESGAEAEPDESSVAPAANSSAIPPGSRPGLDEVTDPLTLRSQTLIAREIEKSLLLYRDAIGMEVIYDNIIRRPHREEDRQQEIRLVFLKASNDFIGVLGPVDYEHNNPERPKSMIQRSGGY